MTIEERLAILEANYQTLNGLYHELFKDNRRIREELLFFQNRPDASFRGRKPEGRNATKLDAWRLRFGDLTNVSHNKAAKFLDLTYGQVYSIRYAQSHKDVTSDIFTMDDVETPYVDPDETPVE